MKLICSEKEVTITFYIFLSLVVAVLLCILITGTIAYMKHYNPSVHTKERIINTTVLKEIHYNNTPVIIKVDARQTDCTRINGQIVGDC